MQFIFGSWFINDLRTWEREEVSWQIKIWELLARRAGGNSNYFRALITNEYINDQNSWRKQVWSLKSFSVSLLTGDLVSSYLSAQVLLWRPVYQRSRDNDLRNPTQNHLAGVPGCCLVLQTHMWVSRIYPFPPQQEFWKFQGLGGHRGQTF